MTGRRERGFTLIEVVIAMFVLAIVMAGAAATVIAVMGAVQVNESRAVASNAIQAELERLRSLPFESLEDQVGSNVTREIDLGGQRFGIERSVGFADLEADADRCTVTIEDEDRQLLQIDIVAWPVTRPEQRSMSSTTVARPPLEGLGPNRGSLTVAVLDHQDPPQPVPFAQIDLFREGETAHFDTRITDEAGCVLFHDLPGPGDPTSSGNYEVRVSKPNHAAPTYISIQPGPDERAPRRGASVLAGGTNTSVEVRYAPEASFDPVTVVPGFPAEGPIELPVDLAVTIERAGFTVTGPIDEPLAPLWPGIFTAWAGTCPAADPMGQRSDSDEADAALLPIWEGASRGDPVTAFAGQATALEVPITIVRLIDPDPTGGQPLFAGRTIIRAVDRTEGTADTGCGGAAENPLVFDFERPPAEEGDPNLWVTLALPFGDWEFEVLRNPSANPTVAATATVLLAPEALDALTDVTATRTP